MSIVLYSQHKVSQFINPFHSFPRYTEFYRSTGATKEANSDWIKIETNWGVFKTHILCLQYSKNSKTPELEDVQQSGYSRKLLTRAKFDESNRQEKTMRLTLKPNHLQQITCRTSLYTFQIPVASNRLITRSVNRQPVRISCFPFLSASLLLYLYHLYLFDTPYLIASS